MENKRDWHPNFPVNLENCQDEPIRIPGAIQTFGILLGFEKSSGRVRAYSHNALEFFPQLKEIENRSVTVSSLVDVIELSGFDDGARGAKVRRLVKAKIAGREHYGVAYESGDLQILEIETAQAAELSGAKTYLSDLPSMMRNILSHADLQELLESTAKKIKQITGFDRVMIYKYDHEWNGEVVAEAKEERLEAFLGLHYPASDIPPQARALYERNWIRIIPTVAYKPSLLMPAKSQTLDLSDSVLRSVSPIHIQYLKNMGVGASMSISLMIDGRLWGLVACHHYSEHFVPVNVRLGCESYGQLVSGHIRSLEATKALRASTEGETVLHGVLNQFGESADLNEAARRAGGDILKLFACTGVVIRLGEETVNIGADPGHVFTTAVAKALGNRSVLDPLVTNAADTLPEMRNIPLHSETAGFMALSLAAKHNYYIICVRPEQLRTVNWAGRPTSRTKTDFSDPSQRLMPRGSFELWAETYRGQSEPWPPDVVDLLKKFSLLFIKLFIERKELVEKSNTELKALNQAKDEFVATVSHELRTPLNAIIGWSELALSGELGTDNLTDAMKIIQRNARSQNQLIGDLLDVSRILSGKLKLSVKNMRVSEIAESVVLSFLPACEAKNIKVISSLDQNSDSIIGDPERIQQIIWNILSNAVKFSPKNSNIWVTVRRENSHIVLEIKDQGIGIEPQFMKYIFGRFNQVDSSIGRKAGGLGLGLSISNHIVELHGGHIKVQSEGPNKGAMFSVYLPIAPVFPEEHDKQMPIHDSFEQTQKKSSTNKARLKGEVVLIVEDETDALKFLEIFISGNGAETFTARNGREALQVLEKNKDTIGIVLSDVGMPEMDGYQLIEAIRRSPDKRISSLCAVALTAFGRPQDRIQALKAGFDSYIAKPVMQEELVTVLETVCKSMKKK